MSTTIIMTKAEYQAIRGEKDFLYRYFIKNGGAQIPYPTFMTLLAMWASTVEMGTPQQAMQKIFNYLDRKFA